LDRLLAQWAATETAWKEYLRWTELTEQLKSDDPDTDILKSISGQLTVDESRLEMPEFRNVAAALDRYVNALSARGDDVPTQYVARLQSLADELNQYQNSRFQSDEIARAVGADLGWLESMRQ